MIKFFFLNFFNLLFPGTCHFCKDELNADDFSKICLKCTAKIKKNFYEDICPVCHHPLDNNKKCPCCNDSLPYNFVQNKSISFNEDKFQKFIYDYKFIEMKSFASTIAYLALKDYEDYFRKFDYFVPIPLSRKKKLERGFCQVTEVVKIISKQTKIPYIFAIKKKSNITKSQHKKSFTERKKTEKDFYFNKKHKDILHNKNVLLVDDILTTGATLNACSKLIKNNTSARVSAFTYARTIKN